MGIENIPEERWQKHSELIKWYLENQSSYQDLSLEVAHILRKMIGKEQIKIAHIDQRVKTLD